MTTFLVLTVVWFTLQAVMSVVVLSTTDRSRPRYVSTQVVRGILLAAECGFVVYATTLLIA